MKRKAPLDERTRQLMSAAENFFAALTQEHGGRKLSTVLMKRVVPLCSSWYVADESVHHRVMNFRFHERGWRELILLLVALVRSMEGVCQKLADEASSMRFIRAYDAEAVARLERAAIHRVITSQLRGAKH